MKNIKILITLTLLSGFGLTAQNKDTKSADKHYAEFEFVEAAEDYAKLVEKGKGDPYIYRQLAESYYNIFNTVGAERFYYKALETAENDAEMTYKYAQMLKANGKYDLFNKYMTKFAELRPNDDRAKAFMANPNYIPQILNGDKKFFLRNSELNTKFSEFGGVSKDGKIYITSSRNVTGDSYGWNQEPFLDIYEFTKKEDGTYEPEVLLGSKINTKYHEGLVSFSPDGKTMYFSRESFFEKKSFERDTVSKNKYSLVHLYRATKSDKRWENIEALPLNNDNYSVKNPSVSADGKLLYFASDMPGGFGLFDIYKSTINEDGSLEPPVNLGDKVNTEGQEMFPYIGSTGTLYFSSNGHLGLGGLDVFFTQAKDSVFGPIRNIGVPVNSNYDDFAFNLDESTGEGFVSSNRPGGVGSDDLYVIKKLEPLCDVKVNATVVDATTGEPVGGAMVSLYDDQNNKLLSKEADAQGKVGFTVECDKDHELEVTMAGYENQKATVDATDETEANVTISLNPIETIIVDGQVKLDPIYFDFDKSNVTSKAAFVLDNLVQVMKDHPEMTISATSHTDNRGSDAYNAKLSDRRAKTTVQYVISKGIDKSRITGEGKGEKEPKVDCGANCSEEEHQLNRRSEFIITNTDTTEMK